MPKFVARIDFEFDADDTKDGSERLRHLRTVAEPVGFKMIRAEVHPQPDGQDRRGPTTYGPKLDPSGGHS